jgi:chaperonin GroEL
MEKVGRDGVVTIEESRSGETYLETVEGMQFDRGYKSPYFVTNNSTMQAHLDKPWVLLYDGRITAVKELLPVLEHASQQNRSLLIIAEDVDNEALATLIVNKMRGTLKVCAVKAPDFGDRRTMVLEDMAILTGGQVISPNKGMKLEKLNSTWLGECRIATVEKEDTTLVDGAGSKEAIEARIKELQEQIDAARTPYEMEKLQERLAKFVGGVAIVHVGGGSELEIKERKDRVEDALHATKAAISEGIVPGGGTALLRARTAITNRNTIGGGIAYEACGAPFSKILTNAGYSQEQIFQLMIELSKEDAWTGYNLVEQEFGDMKEFGIIDPTKVTRNALENAASVAGTVLLTECTIVDKPEDKKADGGMGMDMGGMF